MVKGKKNEKKTEITIQVENKTQKPKTTLIPIVPGISRNNDTEIDIGNNDEFVNNLSQSNATKTKQSNVKGNRSSMEINNTNKKVKKTIIKTSTDKSKETPKNVKSSNKIGESRSARADLTFPVSRVEKMIREGRYTKRCSSETPVFLTAVLEYLALEILELSVTYSNQRNKTRITPQHINLSICNDFELNDLLKNVTIANGGVPNFIHPILLEAPKKKGTQQNTIEKEKNPKK
ncbi:hypothetical protein ACTA71_001179 [Dictyostelium dimigraforme]